MRECSRVIVTVDKRGRGRGFMGWMRGNPWAERRLELEITYTSSILCYFKGENVLRDRIDLMGSTSVQIQDMSSIVDGRKNGVQITLASGEKLYLACMVESDQRKVLQALRCAGDVPTSVDTLAERLHLNVLMKDHERTIYDYINFKGTKLSGGLEASFDPSKPGVITLQQLNEWEALLEEAFPKLYTKNSETATMEEYQKQEFDRKMEMHRIEREHALKSNADESLVKSREDDQVFMDKVQYVMEKEKRFLEQINELVSRYN